MPCIQCGHTIIQPIVVCKHCGKYKVTDDMECPGCGKYTPSTYDIDPQSKLPIIYSEDNKKLCLLCYIRNMMELPNIAFNPNNTLHIPKDSKTKPYYYDVYYKVPIEVKIKPVVKNVVKTTTNDYSGLKSMDKWR